MALTLFSPHDKKYYWWRFVLQEEATGVYGLIDGNLILYNSHPLKDQNLET